MASLIRFLRAWRSVTPSVTAVETAYRRDDRLLPATVYGPPGTGRLPGWVVLHGLTHTGREHPSLVRFVRALAAAGNRVLVPDIPEWRELHVAPRITHETIRAAVRTLHDRDDVIPERVGLTGFSFGATQALIAAAHPEVSALLRGIAAWGGYHDVRRLFVFGITGEHELDGRLWYARPDPYGAWIMSGNYLTHIPGHEDEQDVAQAAHELAREAGRRRVYADDPVYDATKTRLREQIAPGHRAMFDIVAPLSTAPPADREMLRSMSLQLAEAALRVDPLLDPQPWLGRVGTRVLLAHGRDDRLISYTETIRLGRALPPDRLASVAITALFQHSGGANRRLGPVGLTVEGARFLRLLHRILNLI
jgi:pimeloyl-ACP methyl ester carboxylesterase